MMRLATRRLGATGDVSNVVSISDFSRALGTLESVHFEHIVDTSVDET